MSRHVVVYYRTNKYAVRSDSWPEVVDIDRVDVYDSLGCVIKDGWLTLHATDNSVHSYPERSVVKVEMGPIVADQDRVVVTK